MTSDHIVLINRLNHSAPPKKKKKIEQKLLLKLGNDFLLIFEDTFHQPDKAIPEVQCNGEYSVAITSNFQLSTTTGSLVDVSTKEYTQAP